MAKRDKLTQRQKRQIIKTRHRKTSSGSNSTKLGNLGHQRKGLMVSRFGDQADVLGLDSGTTFRCFLRQNLGAPVPGDSILFRLDPNDVGIIEAIEPRRSLLQRPSPHQGLKPVVANIDRVFVLVAPLPDFSSILLDRYLIAIENSGIDIVIVCNKCDLESEMKGQKIRSQLEIYSNLNYPVIEISSVSDYGKKTLIELSQNQQSILVGQSGVGKSSVINWLFPEQSITTQSISENSRLGQHTTTASQLFCLTDNSPSDGFIIDSPGIREFGLWHLEVAQIASGFREFVPFIGGCKFRDCCHINEPGCSIIAAVENKEIDELRWNNYKKILSNNTPNL